MNIDNNKNNNINYDQIKKTNEMSEIILVDDINSEKKKLKKSQYKNRIIEESKNFISSNTKKIKNYNIKKFCKLGIENIKKIEEKIKKRKEAKTNKSMISKIQ